MISINNLTATKVDEEFLKKVAKAVLDGQKSRENDLSIALVGQKRIRKLNREYRAKNRVTDVLSFPGNGLGEILICVKEVKKNAKRYQTSFEKELAKVLIHGVLHLLGEEHEESEEKADKMREKEEHYLKSLYPNNRTG